MTTLDKLNRELWDCIVQTVERMGLDSNSVGNWDQLTDIVIRKLGGTCCLCGAPTRSLSMWKPSNRQLMRIGKPQRRILYLACERHTGDELESHLIHNGLDAIDAQRLKENK